MDKLLSLFIGNNACDLGLAYYYLESFQQFEEDDPMNHEAIFEKHPMHNVPRAMFFGNNPEIQDNLYLTNIQEDQQNQSKQKQQDLITDEQKLTNAYTKKVFLDYKKYYHISKEQKVQTLFHQATSKQRDEISDLLSNQFEKTDRCDGFQMFVDVNNYSFLGSLILQFLKEENAKTPIICFTLNEHDQKLNQLEKDISFVNQSISLIHFSEDSNMVIPINFPIQQFDFFAKRKRFLQYQQASLLLSSITLPYRIKSETLLFENYIKRMTPYPSTNIFNMIAKIPLMNDDPKIHIVNHKQGLLVQPYFKRNYMEKIIRYEEKYNSFAESYSLRGQTKVPVDPYFNSIGLEVRSLEYILNIPETYEKSIFSPFVDQNYGELEVQDMQQTEEKQLTKIISLPFHSCLFSNECYKYNLKNVENQMLQVSQKIFAQLAKEEFTKDDFQEYLQKLDCKIESYGGLYDDDNESDKPQLSDSD